jgi:hypothetical protein
MPKTYPEEIRERVAEQAAIEPRWSAARMRQWLVAEYVAQVHEDDLPSSRTLIEWLRADRSRSRSAPWTLGHERDPRDAALVLRVLREVVERTEGKVNTVTQDEARWLVRVIHARGDLKPWAAYRFARRYAAAQHRKGDYRWLDLQLATVGYPEAVATAFPAPPPGSTLIREGDAEWETVKDLMPGERIPGKEHDSGN